jgi:hypothetical protein
MAENPTALNYVPSDSSLVANGATVAIGPLTVTLAGFDLANTTGECQLGNGGNEPSGTSRTGFQDTTYTLTTAQVLATYGMPS